MGAIIDRVLVDGTSAAGNRDEFEGLANAARASLISGIFDTNNLFGSLICCVMLPDAPRFCTTGRIFTIVLWCHMRMPRPGGDDRPAGGGFGNNGIWQTGYHPVDNLLKSVANLKAKIISPVRDGAKSKTVSARESEPRFGGGNFSAVKTSQWGLWKWLVNLSDTLPLSEGRVGERSNVPPQEPFRPCRPAAFGP